MYNYKMSKSLQQTTQGMLLQLHQSFVVFPVTSRVQKSSFIMSLTV